MPPSVITHRASLAVPQGTGRRTRAGPTINRSGTQNDQWQTTVYDCGVKCSRSAKTPNCRPNSKHHQPVSAPELALFPPAPGLAINVDVRVNGFSKSSPICRRVATGPDHRNVLRGARGLPVPANPGAVRSLQHHVGTRWLWTLAFGQHEDRWPTHGYEPTREAAMAAFAKSWRRE